MEVEEVASFSVTAASYSGRGTFVACLGACVREQRRHCCLVLVYSNLVLEHSKNDEYMQEEVAGKTKQKPCY